MKITHIHCNHCGKELKYPYVNDYLNLSMNIPCGPPIGGDLCESCAEELENIVSNFMRSSEDLIDAEYAESINEEGQEEEEEE